ncbi:unnamed protein product [Peniophora sp. CBMAI 1063]|nr:unnamed protein product [Peniophora sp. CBMAI 1063]
MDTHQVAGYGRPQKVRNPQRATLVARYRNRWAEAAQSKGARCQLLNEAASWVWLTYGADDPWTEVGDVENGALIEAGEWLANEGVVPDINQPQYKAVRSDILRVLQLETQNQAE